MGVDVNSKIILMGFLFIITTARGVDDGLTRLDVAMKLNEQMHTPVLSKDYDIQDHTVVRAIFNPEFWGVEQPLTSENIVPFKVHPLRVSSKVSDYYTLFKGYNVVVRNRTLATIVYGLKRLEDWEYGAND